MGNNEEKPKINQDIKISGDLNIYFLLDTNYMYFSILRKIFCDSDTNKDGYIANNDEKYSYHYRILKHEVNYNEKKIKKNYNGFIFRNKIEQNFSDVLMQHFYKYDVHNKRNNVIVNFGSSEYIKKSIDNMKEKTKESIPLLIIIDNVVNYDEKLNYVNYIPNIDIIKNNLRNDNLSEEELRELSFKAFKNFLITKLYRMDIYYNQIGYNLNLINPLNDINGRIKSNLTIGLVGYSGCGKSTLINLIFNELVSKVNTSATDVTTECTEYYLPIHTINEFEQNIGQIRFLDFPGITEDSNYEDKVEPKIKSKIKEYKNNYEQIDIALFYIPNGVNRELTKSGKKLIKLLNENNIKIIFIINGQCRDFLLEEKKNKIKNEIREIETNNNIIEKDFNNFIHTDYYQYFEHISKEGIPIILEKILEISVKGLDFNIEEITTENLNEKLNFLKRENRIFQLYENISVFRTSAKIKATLSVIGYSTLSCGTSALSLIVPVVDSFISIGYQVGMVYNILYIYELNSRDYNITNIILSGGNTIEGMSEISKTSTKFLTYNTASSFSYGSGETIFLASKETTKEITEKIVIKEGGKSWLVNLGKYVPFIGVGISAMMNTYSTAKIGYKLISKFDSEFENNKQRKVDMLKGRIYSLLNICNQINSLIEKELYKKN